VTGWSDVPAFELVAGARVLVNPRGGAGCPLIRTISSVRGDRSTDSVLVRFADGPGVLELTWNAVVMARLPDQK